MNTEQLELLEKSYQRHLEHYLRVDPDPQWLHSQLENHNFSAQLKLLWGCSDFVAEQAAADPQSFRQLVESGDLQRNYSDNDYMDGLQARIEQLANCCEDNLGRELRLFRRREMMRIIWRDFSRQTPMLGTTRDTTLLAEACINIALKYLHPITREELGAPIGRSSGTEQQLLVIAMGKMGAYELNISSDIDLIFVYPESGETQGGRRSVSNQEFFVRLGQKLIAALDRQTADGFVFRVDMRLRPYGQSGALVLNFDALEEYYLSQGRDWERYAMVKARVVSGDPAEAQALQQMLQPFTYRKYLDFGAIESLRETKRSINREVSRKGMQDNIKLGSGGIREVEFIAQTFQLIRGGRNKRLQTQSLYQVLNQLAEDNVLDRAEQQSLWSAYEFLRNTEHALQGMADKQTQRLPIDDLGQQRLARLMEQSDWQQFYEQLQSHRHQVSNSFKAIISDSAETADPNSELRPEQSWSTDLRSSDILPYLHKLSYQQPQELAAVLDDFYQSRAVQALANLPRTRLESLMPRLLEACADLENNQQTFLRVLGLVQRILRRSAYLALLVENSQALQQLCILCERSSWIADELVAYPALLDELLDSRTLYTAPDKQLLRDQLRQQTMRIASDDMEQQMEVIRYFCRSYALRVAACEVTDMLPLMQVSDYLTWIAEAVVEHVVNIAWDQLVASHGLPALITAGATNSHTPGFIVVAYGKMGGIEMGYKSDLDLVFLHSGDPRRQTDGPRSIDSSTFFMRLGQRIIHLLATSTASGMAYEIDMRLRPSGNSGMLVSSLAAFEKYQREDAWTWEHQALVRSRVVAGDTELAAAYELVRKNTLQQKRDTQLLSAEVREMREKMRKHLGKDAKDGKFSLKQGSGGIVDIEFMVQFAVLAWSHDHPQLVRWSDTIRILESLAQCGLFSEQDALRLIDAYKRFRSAGHRAQLHNQLAEIALSEFVVEREHVAQQWRKLFKS
ncbi:MAG: bifunctional [glutamate--ammonia ligase]-adenylyl-L-tyrosine phosphorylase/[glutamate--ammonia-ligase] adenylyltransferase [Porticoccaceae bacterium]|jgi:glutamate-ammonia-ligase adenylyltransferase|nr:bifunctional [glutamate--ammonia ligase]-adenylyl-L-tyrosine phosphorylase/[glutamate--ammonia-ligase] adenylyltransferase [Porticoccaceae bacterium]MDG1199577.1 bifunctional [glutamate--ammonia ligase]-adenylyl-L-tyrosine phosphorylase/[glutamate--ammonia-ligase] adenylyltransferase [Porticoccaceae bacterium]MDG1707014.1 bifunctional [glutamate--ammonia ligase]-adenylyl-L-tyrosine phosphorylase/[glutamate--ammonia-ligase] adenylyltransferase [Porticoccaceae bacterium]